MQIFAPTTEEYISQLPEDRQVVINQLRQVVNKNLPPGFVEINSYGMLGYVVPHSIYPAGYHCNPKDPLPFLGMASQKNNISFYHMGLYADPELFTWFTSNWDGAKYGKLDMGKSCIRLKKMDKIPYDLLGELCSKMTVEQWIALYERELKK
jgi:hypothetical protein